jgi:hypothetical protein
MMMQRMKKMGKGEKERKKQGRETRLGERLSKLNFCIFSTSHVFP